MKTTEPPFEQVWKADLQDGTYRNPILYADYADPDVIRVGRDFYMVSSSFSHVPGLPVLHSRDLIHWSILGHVLERLDLPGYDLPQHGAGVWAPSIRYREGRFWVYYATPDEGIFMCTAEHPQGPWTAPHLVYGVKGWIDPCPFWDEDGRAYLVHAFAHSRCGIKDRLQLIEMAPDGRSLLGGRRIIFDGRERHPTIEGPKLYKRNGYYYIFAPAGGVKPGWQTVLRSTSIWGPYEDRIVLHQGTTDVNGPHQGGWIELESGESWFLHFQDRGAYGRILHLQPMRWTDDWPVMGAGEGEIGEPVAQWTKPDVGGVHPPQAPAASDDFAGPRLGLQWQWQANPGPGWHSLAARRGHLRLYAAPLPAGKRTLYDAPQLLLQKFPAPSFAATAKLELAAAGPADRAGLIVFGIAYACLAVEAGEDGVRLSLMQGHGAPATEQEVWAAGLERFPASGLYLRVTISGPAGGEPECAYSYSLDGKSYLQAGAPVPASPGKWVGAKVGIFCVNREGAAIGGHADFDWFRVDELP